MKNFLLLFLLFPVLLFAQISNYELEFNSATQDYVEMPNTSSVIANKIAFSISGWVNPQSNSTHGGIMGFRNNVDADFYLLQLQNTNNIEARFRGSSGVSYDIVAANILDFNQWQHLAFTYDGSYIRLYKDGALVDSSVANGIIGQNTLPLQLGKLDWQTTGFYLNGKLDEIRLWDVALSQVEINNWMCIPIDLTHPNYNNLMGYWRLNDGVGTTATDLSVNANNGTLNNNPTWQVSTTCFGSTTPPLTYVPDDNFENYLEANNMGNGIANDDYVNTASIDTAVGLYVDSQNISDLTGIEDFIALVSLVCNDNQLTTLDLSDNTSLSYLECWGNQLTSLDLSQNLWFDYLFCEHNQITNIDLSNNTALITLWCFNNQLTSLDVSQNTALIDLACQENQLTSLDVSNNTALISLGCSWNLLTSLDVSNNIALDFLQCDNNQLTSLDVSSNAALVYLQCNNNLLNSLDLRNGNNTNTSVFYAVGNPNLTCIDVDNVAWSTTNWTNIDPQHYFSNDCNATAIEETIRSEKELIKVIDVLGRKKSGNKQELLFYIYKDGIVEKRIVIE